MKGKLRFVAILLSGIFSTSTFAQLSVVDAAVNDFTRAQAANSMPASTEHWIQPDNRQEKCELRFTGSDVPEKTKWFGDCSKGKASGIGISAASSPSSSKSMVSLEEFSEVPSKRDTVYRSVVQTQEGTFVFSGVQTDFVATGHIWGFAKSPVGVSKLESKRLDCHDGECINQRIDGFTGTITFERVGNSGYNVSWSDMRINNASSISTRSLSVNGVERAKKMIVAGNVYDFALNTRSGQSEAATFNGDLNDILASPYDRYSASSKAIDEAVALSDQKFLFIYKRFCAGATAKDVDVKKLCQPSALSPAESEYAEAKATANRNAQAAYDGLLANVAARQRAKENAIAQSQAQEQLEAQQKQIEAMRVEQRQQAIRQGLSAIGQLGKDAQNAAQQMGAQSNQYLPPQVTPLAPYSPPIMHCRTIGYITTCN